MHLRHPNGWINHCRIALPAALDSLLDKLTIGDDGLLALRGLLIPLP